MYLNIHIYKHGYVILHKYEWINIITDQYHHTDKQI